MNQYNSHQVNLPAVTPMVKKLLIVTSVIWLVLQMVLDSSLFLQGFVLQNFSLVPGKVIYDFSIWQPLTYMFLHSTEHLTHIIFNMLLLWMLGGELEQRWGSRFFLAYYLVSGVGAALIYTVVSFIYASVTGNPEALIIPVIGASGAVFGLMLAYGILFGERIIYFMMIFPMKAKYFVTLLGVIELITLFNAGVGGGKVATLAHLGGLISGFLFLFFWTKSKQRNWRLGKVGRGKNKRSLHIVKEENESSTDGPKYWN